MKKLFVLVFLLAGAAAAQTNPALISDPRVLPNDSPLVAAAKRALARRRALAGQTIWVIDDGMVQHRLLAAPSAPLPLTASAPATGNAPPPTFSSYDGTAARQAAERQRAALLQEQRIMAEESEQPYGGDVGEDRVEQRMTEIPKQIEALQPTAPPAKPPQ